MKCIRVRVKYLAPYIKSLIGLDEETIMVEEGASVRDVILKIAEIHGGQLLTQLLSDDGGRLRESLLALVNNVVVQDVNCRLRDGDTVTLLIAINGG